MHTMRWNGVASRLRIVMGSTCLSLLSGCALFDPYPTPAGPTLSDQQVRADFIGHCQQISGFADESNETLKAQSKQLCDAFGYAEGYRLAYVSAARQHALARNVAAFATVPLAAVAVFEGLRDNGSSSRIARLGVEAVAVYSLTNFLTSTPRQKVYLSGAKAMVCAMFEARPLLVGLSYLGELDRSVKEEAAALQALNSAIDAAHVSDQRAPNFVIFLKAQSDAKNVLAEARLTESELRIAGMTLHNRVDMIATEVNDLVTDTQPSTEAIQGLFGNFGALTAGFKQSVAAAKPATVGAAPQAGDFAANELKNLQRKTAELSALLENIGDSTTVIDHISQCKPAGEDSGFALSPNQASVTVDVGASFEFTVTNKIATPTRHLEGSNQDAVTLGEITVKGGDKFGISVKGIKTTGSNGPTLVISDGTGSTSKLIQVVVTPAEKKANEAAPKHPSGDVVKPLDPNTEAPKLSDAGLSVKSLQCYLGVTTDGVVGKDTREAIGAKRTSTPDDPDHKDRVDAPLVTELGTALGSTAAKCKDLK